MNPHLTVNSDAVIVISPFIRAKINSNHKGQTRDKPVLENSKQDSKQDRSHVKAAYMAQILCCMQRAV